MKKIFVLLLALGFSPLAQAEIEIGRLNTAGIGHCLAKPEFAKALLEANTKANGFKIRIDYRLDHTYRTTRETIQVNVAGRTENPAQYTKAGFTVEGQNGCWRIVSVSPVEVSAISDSEYANFDN